MMTWPVSAWNTFGVKRDPARNFFEGDQSMTALPVVPQETVDDLYDRLKTHLDREVQRQFLSLVPPPPVATAVSTDPDTVYVVTKTFIGNGETQPVTASLDPVVAGEHARALNDGSPDWFRVWSVRLVTE